MTSRADDLLQYVRENAASLREAAERDPLSVPVAGVALINVLTALDEHLADGNALPAAWAVSA